MSFMEEMNHRIDCRSPTENSNYWDNTSSVNSKGSDEVEKVLDELSESF